MGSSEVGKSSKEGKEAKEPKTPTGQEQSSAPAGPVGPDWTGFQTYSPMPPPPGYMAASPQAHPYMWGVQQFIPPYGTPPPYVAMYPHGGIYAHPPIPLGSYPFSPFPMPSPNGIAEGTGNTPVNIEVDGKASEAKGKLPIKRSKGSLGSLNMITGKNNEPVKTSGATRATPNGVHSKIAESESEGSSDGSDANSQNDSQGKPGGRPDSAVGAVSGVPSPTTNLNIGMDYGTAPSSAPPAIRGKVSAPPVAGGISTTGSRDNIQSQHWIQDERELKRQRRKQSNRESARRSRLRKQAECDELAQRAEILKEENASLRSEVAHIRTEYDQLVAQNASLKERLGDLPGQEDPRCSRDDRSNSDAQ